MAWYRFPAQEKEVNFSFKSLDTKFPLFAGLSFSMFHVSIWCREILHSEGDVVLLSDFLGESRQNFPTVELLHQVKILYLIVLVDTFMDLLV